jgi:C4-type Zn-finger protein
MNCRECNKPATWKRECFGTISVHCEECAQKYHDFMMGQDISPWRMIVKEKENVD